MTYRHVPMRKKKPPPMKVPITHMRRMKKKRHQSKNAISHNRLLSGSSTACISNHILARLCIVRLTGVLSVASPVIPEAASLDGVAERREEVLMESKLVETDLRRLVKEDTFPRRDRDLETGTVVVGESEGERIEVAGESEVQVEMVGG